MKSDTFRLLGWAAYLCCSWMWCIGMFYPVLLYRDFGISAWFIFTLPNVVGAALVPWFIRSAQSSEKFTRNHSFACQFFSIATILFNLYFLSWVLVSLGLSIALFLSVATFLVLLFVVCRKHIQAASVITLIVSLCMLLLIFVFLQENGLVIPREKGAGLIEALGLVPVFQIGFLFCPYLDLTFHRVIKESKQSRAKLTYIIGFFLFFLSFLILGFKYYPVIYNALLGSNNQPKSGIVLAIYFYLIVQASFTIVVHLIELFKQKPTQATQNLLIFSSVCVFLYAVLANGRILVFGEYMHLREILYRAFLSVYGLLAPIYIWMFAVIKFGKSQRYVMNYQRGFIWFIAVLLAAPFYILGFYGNSGWIVYVLPVGVTLALLTPFKSVAKVTLRLLGNKK